MIFADTKRVLDPSVADVYKLLNSAPECIISRLTVTKFYGKELASLNDKDGEVGV